ncbi:probable receptor-like serine/threonine-protein kinase At4g34500 [Phoenix dactylifera]|uniref:non-specific serine/threonine protein kinase n=1 Tax=Phoenix dactylifera TaxID=42345 RepID=A0A8B7BUH0_PHODC|nr:probable receptor-like serine/threonine-protein kinase At4g34500 [Phoenix dactylifera]XP_008785670.1 probable receptor-like serine/threonine-protein kinase At4g34500 [Phoenix dactylifera]XP_008785671.1 probable receptor-like serine/threonine-protein kinase At4g34500 [Phoenix dactylifera]XP_008785672.1 probable receptor-like serine/threonine-protein kinase At4g34500 [Phoenix dactylifera]XP_026659314.1 probable receptor-like serine/threonine-protein kinase At4g34500 [Phoenix dactylifera]XP_02
MGAGTLTSGGFLAEKTAVLGLPVYILVAIAAALLLAGAILAFLFFRRRAAASRVKHTSGIIPSSTKEISVDQAAGGGVGEVEVEEEKKGLVGVNKGERLRGSSSGASSSEAAERMGNIGWGRWYSLAELEAATGAFSAGNVIGEGGYGVVYKGVLPDLSVVAVKNLLNNKGQAEKEFKVEVEAIGKVRHKHLVGLVGYCAEGAKRMLVYEYIDNGNLDRWLHGDVGPVSPLTWDIRMKIAIGTAKGIAYLHEGLEPKVVHRDIKSSNILLDKHWNPKVSDFGLAKLLGSGSSFVTTRVMGTFGYVAPEYACTGMLNESSDVYSFGVLLMELISGRCPVDYSRPPGEVNLVEWFKGMVGSRRGEEVVDPLMEVQPSPRALKRVLLVCLRCVDLDAQKRPKMGQIVHMLEGDEFPFRTEHRLTRERMLDVSNAPTGRIPLLSEKVIAADSERSMWR